MEDFTILYLGILAIGIVIFVAALVTDRQKKHQ